MARQLVTLLIFSLTLLAGACSDQGALGPSQGDDQQGPSLNIGKVSNLTPTKKSPGGSAGGWK